MSKTDPEGNTAPPKTKTAKTAKTTKATKTTKPRKARTLQASTLRVYVKNYMAENPAINEESTIEDLMGALGDSIIAQSEERFNG